MTIIDETTRTGLSASELVSVLRQAIITGELVPKQRLVEADLAAEYGASRGNIRVALSELSVEGLVERVQNRGARVRAVSVEEAVEITEVRGALEALCARKAAQRISDLESEELRELARHMEDAVARGDRESYSDCNQRLHAKIIAVSGQETAASTIQRLRGQAVRFQFRLARQPGRPAVSLPQHLAIIDAVCRHDSEGAAEAMRLHLESVADAIRGPQG
ncbi:GntR family transcriptional regulator [Arthrobacter sp. CDRTa11]|uniref:GntR family transcriptional regulator n=1 Tax=Arthrobacter sp. CDRTa11 TaxID=2651199 RepID=UPI002265DD70|nr:GntR family transcriptional regulator [Arthrobacter sp. CDRTa11]UZX03320.1 GntR family transcriptional regulator [Arthrobacter sp. CDRTa11]